MHTVDVSQSAFGGEVAPRESVVQFTAQLLHDAQTTVSSGRGNMQYIHQLDADMEHLMSSVLQLRRSRNACTPLLRLPSELVENIIMAVAASGWRPTQDNILGWLVLTHVCRDMRLIALQLQRVWADSVFYVPRLAACEEMLSRAGNLPLSIALNDFFGGNSHLRLDSNIAELAYEKLHLARFIDIHEEGWAGPIYNSDDGGLWPYTPSDFGGRTFPNMEAFRLVRTYPRRYHSITTQEYLLPLMVTPKLRSMYLKNAYIPFSSRTLTSLTLVVRPADGPDASWVIPTQRFLEILRDCASLKELTLDNAIPDLNSGNIASIFMPGLVKLSVTDAAERVLALLDRLVVPPRTVQSIMFAGQPPGALDHVFSSFRTVERAITLVDIKISAATRFISLRFFDGPLRFPRSTDSTGAEQQIHSDKYDTRFYDRHLYDERLSITFIGLERAFYNSLVVELIEQCTTAIDSTSACMLQIEVDHLYAADQWARMLEPFVAVKSLTMYHLRRGWSGKRIAHSTTDHNAIMLAFRGSPCLLPRLELLNLEELRFGESLTTTHVLEMLQRRQVSGSGLQRLRVRTISFASREFGSAARWAKERAAFLDRVHEYGTCGEEFFAEPDETTEDPEVRRVREEKAKRREELVRYVEAGVMNAELVLSTFDGGVDLGNSFMSIQ